jgi:dipeptidyl aminopeptidase/acylaminoacyl peptidase
MRGTSCLEVPMPRMLGPAVAVLSIVVAVFASAGHAQQSPPGRALTIEDYYRIQAVGSPAISPAGRWVSFTISARIEEDNSTRTETWVVSTDGTSKPWRVLHYGHDVTGARWAVDDRLEYGADRQRWSIDPSHSGAPPVKAGALGGGGRGGRGGGGDQAAGVPSPDGKWVATAIDKPQTRRDPEYAGDFERRHEERFKGAIFDWKDFQRDGQPFPAPNLRARPAAQIVIAAATGGGDRKMLTDLDLRPTGLQWRPDGTGLLFIADSDWRDELKYESPDLWSVTIDGKVTRLTDDGYVHSDASFSPDGRYLSYVRDPGTDLIIRQKLNHGGPSDLYVRPLAGGEPTNLTADWDLEPGPTRWSPDSRFIYFTAGIGGESHVFRVSVPAGRVEQVTSGPRRIAAVTFDKAFTKIAFTVGVPDAPPEVHVANIDGTGERRLTDVHKAIVSEIAVSRVERLRWPSYDGTAIEGWLTFPYGYDAKKGPYPLIVTSHGGPHSATGWGFDFKDQYFAANGYFVFDTNFRSSTGYGEAFKWATWGEWGRKDGEDVVSGIDYVVKRYPIDAKRVGHTGHSYGGFMTNWLITQYPDRFAAAITGAGITNWISDYGTADIYRTKETEFYGPPWDPAARERMIRQSPLTWAGNVKTPTLFIHGEADQRVPYEEGEQMYFALKRRGIPAKMIQYAGQPHGIGGHWNNVHRMINELKWWDRYLKGPKPTSTAPSPEALE